MLGYLALCSLPASLLFWTPGIWLIQAVFLLLWTVQLAPEQRQYAQTVAYLRRNSLAKNLFTVALGYLLWCAVTVVGLNSSLQALDNGIIFVVWCLMLPVMSVLKPNHVFLAVGGFLALLVALGIALTQFHVLHLERAFGLYGNSQSGSGAIKFGDMALLLGVLALILLAQLPRLKLIGFLSLLLGILISIYASSRGSFLALLLCIIVWHLSIRKQRHLGPVILIGAMSGLVLLYSVNWLMHDYLLARIIETRDELQSVFAFKLSTPIGIRVQLWSAAIIMFMDNPILGVGINNFSKTLKGLHQHGLVSDSAAHFSHAHNEFLCALASGGLVGFTLTVLLFVLPIKLFRRDYHVNLWAKAGFWSACLLSFFALTDCIFDRRMTTMAFAVLISTCMAGNIAFKRKTNTRD